MSSGGPPCSSTKSFENTDTGKTFILYDGNTIDVDGEINQACIHATNSGSGKIKIFREVGVDFNFVSEASISWAAGQNTYSISLINVLSGDLVAIYLSSGGYDEYNAGAGTTEYSKVGDITSNSAKSTWSTAGYACPIVEVTFQGSSDIYVHSTTGSDSNAGDSCASGHPLLTFAKAIEYLAPGGTIHVCNSGADFSLESVVLKSLLIDLNGADGYFYMPQST